MTITTNSPTHTGSDTHTNMRAQDQQLYNYVAITLMTMDLVYFAIIYMTSLNPWLSLGLAFLIPAVNVSAVFLENKTGRVLITYTLPLSLFLIFFLTYVSGVNSPAWLIAFGSIIAANIIYPIKKLKIPLISGFIGCALLGTWFTGGSNLHLLIIAVTLISVSVVLNRIFNYLESLVHRMRNEITERKRAEGSCKVSETRYSDATRIANLGHWVYDEVEDRLIFSSEELANIHGVTPAEYTKMVSSTDGDIERVHPDDREDFRNVIKNAQREMAPYDIVYKIVKPNGELRYIREIGEPVCDSTGKLILSRGTLQDITILKQAEAALKISEARYQAVVENQTEIITRFTPDGIFTFVNEAYCRFVGKKQENLIGTSIYNDVPEDVIPDLKKYFNSFNQKQTRLTKENHIKNAADELRYFDWSNSATFDEQGNITEILSVGRDITERKQAEAALQVSEQLLQKQVVELKYNEERLEEQAENLITLAEDLEDAKQEMQHLANHDALTGLPSLRLCNERLASALAIDRRNKSQTAVLFIDLDGFKAINDTLGHEAGDEVLKGVAERLKSSIREVDTASRIGGDEFIVVLPETGEKDNIAIVAKKIIAKLSEPFTVDNAAAHIGASIGIAISPADGVTADELLRHADEAMYVIKKQGKNSYGFFA